MGQYDPKKPSAFNIVNILIVLGLGTVGYLGWWYLPHWYPVWQLSGIMRGAANDAYREFNNDKLLQKLLKDSQRTGLKLTAENFTIERTGYTNEEMQAAVEGKELSDHARMLFEQRGKTITIYFENTVTAKWPLQDKSRPLTFRRTVSMDLATIKW